MANVQIKDITAAVSAAVTDQFVIDNSDNLTKRVTGQQTADMVKAAIGSASAVNAGLVDTVAQTLAGDKTLTGVTSFQNAASQIRFGTSADQGSLVAGSSSGSFCYGLIHTGSAWQNRATTGSLFQVSGTFFDFFLASGTVGGAPTFNQLGRWSATGLGVKTSAPACALDAAGTIRATATTDPPTGVGLESGYSPAGNAGFVQAFDRSGVAWKGLRLSGSTVTLAPNASTMLEASSSGIAIGGGTALSKVVVYGPSLTPAAVAASSASSQQFTVAGLTTADKVAVNGPSPSGGAVLAGARVVSPDTIELDFINPYTVGAGAPAGVYRIVATRS